VGREKQESISPTLKFFQKEAKKKDHEQYGRLAKQCGLENVSDENDFRMNIDKARIINDVCTTKETELKQQRDNVVSGLRKNEGELDIEQQELASLKERKTQIPAWLVGFRTQLCEDLQIDEEDLPFAGELLQVNENESSWEGAIEKLLRDTGISLLVPREHYRSVSRYVNDNPLRGADGKGIKLTYLDADTENSINVTRQLDNDSIVYKVDIKPDSPFEAWLGSYLQRTFGDFLCIDVNQLQHVPYGITQQGLIKSGKIRYSKDDRRKIDDRRNYVLGWSNVEKIKVLEETITDLENKIFNLNKPDPESVQVVADWFLAEFLLAKPFKAASMVETKYYDQAVP